MSADEAATALGAAGIEVGSGGASVEAMRAALKANASGQVFRGL
jgi:hypothetical protein